MIIAAAVRRGAKVYALPAPARHGDVLDLMAEALPDEPWPIDGDQGFIDSEQGFVTRRRAANIAISQGQIAELKYQKFELFSEDLW